jgi:hypothetical protein
MLGIDDAGDVAAPAPGTDPIDDGGRSEPSPDVNPPEPLLPDGTPLPLPPAPTGVDTAGGRWITGG